MNLAMNTTVQVWPSDVGMVQKSLSVWRATLFYSTLFAGRATLFYHAVVLPSVRPSVTRRYYTKTVKALFCIAFRIFVVGADRDEPSPKDGTKRDFAVFASKIQLLSRYCHLFHKISQNTSLSAVRYYCRKGRVQSHVDRVKMQWKTKKSYVAYRMAPWMILKVTLAVWNLYNFHS